MKSNTREKSSVTLAPSELVLLGDLKKRLGFKKNVEVIRAGLKLLKEQSDRTVLRKAFADAARKVRGSTKQALEDLEHLSGEGLE